MSSQSTQSHESEYNPLADLTGFQRDIMAALKHVGPCRGLKVKDYLENTGYDEITHGRLYPNMDTLVDKNLLRKRVREQDNRSNEYDLTTDGVQSLMGYRSWFNSGGSQ